MQHLDEIERFRSEGNPRVSPILSPCEEMQTFSAGAKRQKLNRATAIKYAKEKYLQATRQPLMILTFAKEFFTGRKHDPVKMMKKMDFLSSVQKSI